jgi:hypothetical protein
MLEKEAIWLSDVIYSLEANHLFPMVNIGSSNKKFRESEQPWIDRLLFKPAVNKDYTLIHTDIKADEGVDLVGDLHDLAFLETLKSRQIKSVLCSNLLEHVPNRELICQNITAIIPIGGYLIVTVPYEFPLHLDPIDTLFRPDLEELRAAFPDLEFIKGAIVTDGKLYQCTTTPQLLYLIVMAIRMLLPIYQPLRWFDSLRYSLWLFRNVSATCAVFQKNQ